MEKLIKTLIQFFMADDLNKTGKQDDSKINVGQAHEISYWTRKWGISEVQLKNAVAAAGVYVKDVEAWLKKNKMI